MNYFCTHSDKNYLAKGITLFNSIKQQAKDDFRLYYLCLDDETFNVLKKLSLKQEYDKLKPLSLNHILSDDELQRMRNFPKCNYGDEYSQFCWALTPYFTWWLLKNKLPENANLLYADADLFFYNDPAVIVQKCENHHVGIHRHRFRTYDMDTNPVGEFNVGCVYFKNTMAGKSISTMWKFLLMNPGNHHAAKFGTCGDQKYWDWIYYLSGQKDNICVFDPDDGSMAHGAPWNFSIYEYKGDNKVSNDGRIQTMLFNHFSHFNADMNGWRSSNHGEWKPEDNGDWIKQYYENYYQEIKKAMQLIEANT